MANLHFLNRLAAAQVPFLKRNKRSGSWFDNGMTESVRARPVSHAAATKETITVKTHAVSD